jgi:hypothetical protein
MRVKSKSLLKLGGALRGKRAKKVSVAQMAR